MEIGEPRKARKSLEGGRLVRAGGLAAADGPLDHAGREAKSALIPEDEGVVVEQPLRLRGLREPDSAQTGPRGDEEGDAEEREAGRLAEARRPVVGLELGADASRGASGSFD